VSPADTLAVTTPRASRSRTGRAWAAWGALLPGLAVIAGLLVWPILLLLGHTLLREGTPFGLYLRVFTTPAYHQPLVNTFVISGLVTVGTILAAYPLAYLMATARPRAGVVLTFLVLLPFWTSALVRTTAWIILLQKQGVLNALLLSTGLVEQPIAFVFNLSGVLIGMIHVLMPFVVFPLYAAFCAVDLNLLLAAESLGAGSVRSFTRVLGPLTAPGVVAGALIVFMSAIGYYITPALLGGPGQTMLSMMIQFHLQEQLDWGMAATLSVTLVVATLLIFAVFQRTFGLDRLWGGFGGTGGLGETLGTRSAGRYRRSAGGWVAVVVALGVVVFLIAPIVMVFPMSLSRSPFLVFPPPSYSWRWYENLLHTAKWWDALRNSLAVAALAVPLATVLGTSAALGTSLIPARVRAWIEAVVILPVIVPTIVVAVALYYFYAPIGLVGTRVGLAVGHAVLGLPFVFLTVRASFKSFDRSLELAALGLGASWGRMFWRVMLPHLRPGILAGAVFAFITSFDDVILAIFLTNIHSRTLPKLMYEGVAHEIDPTITAVAGLLILVSLGVLVVCLVVRTAR
jgi:putative spermidine/putrescine transport system permease protein